MFMISSRDFTCSSCSMATVVVTGHSSRRSTPPRWTPTGDGLQRGQLCWPPLGRTVGRQRAATWPPLGRISWPPTYVLFRFGPIVMLSLFFGRQLAHLEWPAWPFVAAAFATHTWPTSLRAVWRLLRYRRAGERSTPLVVLHLVTAATVGLCLLGAALLRQHLTALIPDFEGVRDGLWTGLIASLLAFGFLHWTRAPERTLADIVFAQRQRVVASQVWCNSGVGRRFCWSCWAACVAAVAGWLLLVWAGWWRRWRSPARCRAVAGV